MKYKILTNSDGARLINYILNQGLLNNGFDSKEKLKECFPDSKLNITYVNDETTKKIYAIKNITTNKLVYDKMICNPPHKYYEKLGNAEKALKDYKNQYESKLKNNQFDNKKKLFLLHNLPEDLEVVTYYLIEESNNENNK